MLKDAYIICIHVYSVLHLMLNAQKVSVVMLSKGKPPLSKRGDKADRRVSFVSIITGTYIG